MPSRAKAIWTRASRSHAGVRPGGLDGSETSNRVRLSWITTLHWKPITMSASPLFVSEPVRTPSCVIVRVPDQEAALEPLGRGGERRRVGHGHQITVVRVRRDRRIEKVEAAEQVQVGSVGPVVQPVDPLRRPDRPEVGPGHVGPRRFERPRESRQGQPDQDPHDHEDDGDFHQGVCRPDRTAAFLPIWSTLPLPRFAGHLTFPAISNIGM